MGKPRDGSELSVEGTWDLQVAGNSGREAWERKWGGKVPGKVTPSVVFSLVAKR